ncbi:CPK1 [Symbiodinium natans]|uniref:CPK1 protein n=1 Tax=Symbiodinium natans TaxID=878477 RepID=A0A812T397_9DINO|nr:CPK1 [Symbiodinium natans]
MDPQLLVAASSRRVLPPSTIRRASLPLTNGCRVARDAPTSPLDGKCEAKVASQAVMLAFAWRARGALSRRSYEPFGGIYAREYTLRRYNPRPEQSWLSFPLLALALSAAWQVFHNWTQSLISLSILSFLVQCYVPEWEDFGILTENTLRARASSHRLVQLERTKSLETRLRHLSQLQAHVSVEAPLSQDGALGAVLLCKDRTGDHVAVKVISLKKAQAAGIEESRLWREVQVMKEVQHPNLPRLIDVVANWETLPQLDATPPHLCLIMEFVQKSEPLSMAVRRQGAMPHRAAQIVAQLASALCKLHRANIIHRDVWCENVLIGDREKIVLINFGRAEYLSGRPAANSKLNTPYMSPEAASGMPQQTGDDAWGLGLLLTEIVTGRFVVDRLGRSDVPLHVQRPTLTAAVQETAACAAPALAQLASQLLDLSASRRPAMVEVISLLRPSTHNDSGQPTSHAAERADRKALNKLRASQARNEKSPLGFRGRLQNNSSPVRLAKVASPILAQAAVQANERPSRHSFGGKSTQFESPPANFQPGETVLYCPRSQAGVLKAIVCGKLADGKGWRIQLESGEFQEVEKGEDWRLCLSDLPVAPPHKKVSSPREIPTSTAAAKPPMKGPVLAWAPEANVMGGRGKVLASSSTVSSLATTTPSAGATSEASSHAADGSSLVACKSYHVASVNALPVGQQLWAGRCASPTLRRVGSANYADSPKAVQGYQAVHPQGLLGQGPALRFVPPPQAPQVPQVPQPVMGRRVLYTGAMDGSSPVW